MRVLVDTNVILDVLCNRKNFVADSLRVFQCCEAGRLDGYISALSIPNIVYIMRRELERDRIREVLRTLTAIFSIVELREGDLLKAAELPVADYEDAIQSVGASRIQADYIVTRNIRDFTNSPTPAVTPGNLLKWI